MSTKICSFGGCKSVAVSGTSRCEKHSITYTPKKRYDHQLHDGKYIYGTARWRRLRDSFIRMNPLCQCDDCKAAGLTTPGEMVDHVKELKDGGDPWDVENLRTMSFACHAKKTGEEVKKRRKSKGFKSISDF